MRSDKHIVDLIDFYLVAGHLSAPILLKVIVNVETSKILCIFKCLFFMVKV